MEKFSFSYINVDDVDDDKVEIILNKENSGGFRDYDVCEAFVDFMRAVGFSEENVFKYFKK